MNEICGGADASKSLGRRMLNALKLFGCYGLFAAGTFLMLWLGSRLDPKDMALNRFLASGQAPLVGLLGYPEAKRDDISVLLYDDEYLRANASAWPVSYGAHADWILSIVENEALRPKAIFLDVTFAQARQDSSIKELKDALCRVQHEFKVPIFLAALPSDATGQLQVRPELQAALKDPRGPCFTPVGVSFEPDPVDNVSWNYPVERFLTEHGWSSELHHGVKARASFPSAAAAIARDVGKVDLGEEHTPMAIQWGVKAGEPISGQKQFNYCRSGGPIDYYRLIPGVLRDMFSGVFSMLGVDIEEVKKPICPYHRTFSMATLGSADEKDLSSALRDKYVLIGAQISGYNDYATSPVHGLIPGVHLHAMALDNFLSFGGKYKAAVEWEWRPKLPLFLAGVLSTLAMFTVRILINLRKTTGPNYFVKHVVLLRSLVKIYYLLLRYERNHRHPFVLRLLIRLLQGAGKVLGWLFRLSFWFAVAMIFIVVAQSLFPIGMLPVAELAAMIVFAESIHYYEKFEHVLIGKDYLEEVLHEIKHPEGGSNE